MSPPDNKKMSGDVANLNCVQFVSEAAEHGWNVQVNYFFL